MLLLIDGYNVLKQMSTTKHVSQHKRAAFVNQLALYARKKKHELMVVFDGGESSYPFQERVRGITVVYSGYKESADDAIMRLIRELKGREVLVVSSDRELVAGAKTYGVESLTTPAFRVFLADLTGDRNKQPQKETKLRKITERNNPGLDQLMEQATQNIPVKDDEVPEGGRSTARGDKLSKKERYWERKIKKL